MVTFKILVFMAVFDEFSCIQAGSVLGRISPYLWVYSVYSRVLLSFGLKQLNPSEFFRRYPALHNSTKARRLDEDRKQQEKAQGVCSFKFNSVKSYYAIRAMTTVCCKILTDFFETRSDENKPATDTEKKEYGIPVLGLLNAEYGCNLSCRMSEYDMNKTRTVNGKKHQNSPADFMEHENSPHITLFCSSKVNKSVDKVPLWNPTPGFVLARKIVKCGLIPWTENNMSDWATGEIQKTSFRGEIYSKMNRVDVLCKHFGIDVAITEGYEHHFHLCSDMRKIGLALTAMCIEHDNVISTGSDLAMVQAGHGSIAMTKRYLGHRVDGGSELPKYCHVTELDMSSLKVIKAHVVEDIAGKTDEVSYELVRLQRKNVTDDDTLTYDENNFSGWDLFTDNLPDGVHGPFVVKSSLDANEEIIAIGGTEYTIKLNVIGIGKATTGDRFWVKPYYEAKIRNMKRKFEKMMEMWK